MMAEKIYLNIQTAMIQLVTTADENASNK